MEELTNEEVLEETQPTEEEAYDAEYEKAWGDEELEQSQDEPEADVDVPVEEESTENSNEVEESDVEAEESTEEEKPSEDFAEVLKWKGKEIPVTREELIALGQKGFDSEKKWQEAAINRPIKELVDKYGFTPEQLEMFGNITADKNAEALALLAQQNGIDLYDAEHKDYKPQVEAKNYELDDVVAEINQNEEIASQMNDYVSAFPQSVKDSLIEKPEILRGLNIDMQNGIAQKIMPEVIKQYAINPRQDFLSLYQSIGTNIFSQQEAPVETPVAEPTKPKATSNDKRRVAVQTKAPTQDKVITDDYDAAWDDDKHFEAVRRRLAGF